MDSYDFSDLVLLIGTNPLPNFVVAKYFMEHNLNLHRIWMFCSEETQVQGSTEKLADNLISVIKEINKNTNKIIEFSKLRIRDIGDAESIFNRVVEMQQKIIKSKNFCKVHLNYR